MLELDQARRLFIEVHAGLVGARRFGIGRDPARDARRRLAALHAHADAGNRARIGIGDAQRAATTATATSTSARPERGDDPGLAQADHRQRVAVVAGHRDRGRDSQRVATARHAVEPQLEAVQADRRTRHPGAGAGAAVAQAPVVVTGVRGECNARRQAGVVGRVHGGQRGNRRDAGVVLAQAGRERRSGGDAARAGQHRGQGLRGGGHRLQQEAVTGHGRAGGQLHGHAVKLDAGGKLPRRPRVAGGGLAIGQARDAVVRAVEVERVIARLDLRRISHRQAQAGRAGIARGAQHAGRVECKDRRAAARRLAQVEAERLLQVDLAADRRGHLAEQVARRRQVVVLELQQARDRAAGQRVLRHEAVHAAFAQAELHLRGIEAVGIGRQQVRGGAEHQVLTAADEQADAAVVGTQGRHVDEFGELAHEVIPLVEQLVRRLARAAGLGNALVQACDLAGQRIDAGHRGLQVLRDAGLQGIQLVAHMGDASRRFPGVAEHHLARRCIGRVVGEVGKRVHELARRIAHAGAADREQGLELGQLVEPRRIGRGGRAGGHGVVRQELVVGARHRSHVHALAEEASAGELAGGVGELHLLVRIAGRVGVGDVVAGGLQGSITGVHRRLADRHQGGHAGLAFRPGSAGSQAAPARP